MVTNGGEGHTSAVKGATGDANGYNAADGIWSFFSQFLTSSGSVIIVSNPVPNFEVAGQPASFWVSATGTGPLTYQWQKNGVNIAGATNNYYTTPPTATGDDGSIYQAVVTNGTSSALSTSASLTVTAAPAGPTITSQPADVTVTAGQTLSFSVGPTGNYFYQWYENGMTLTGATSSTYKIPHATIHESGATFYATVRNATGTTTSTHATATVLEIPGLPIVTADLVELIAPLNQTGGAFVATAYSATPMTYQWQSHTVGNNFSNVAGATGSSYTPPPSGTSTTTAYQCVISNAVGSTITFPSTLFVSSGSAPSPPQQLPGFGGSTMPEGQTAVPFSYPIQVLESSFPLTYSVTGNLPGGLTVNANTGFISGTPTATGVFPITITATNSGGSLSGAITIAITTTPPPISISDWRWANFGPSGNNALVGGDKVSLVNDGVTNLFAYALGINPLTHSALPVTSQIQGGYLTLSTPVNPNATGITMTAQASSDLINWGSAGTTILQNNSSGFSAKDNTPAGSVLSTFLRLQITDP